MSTHVETAFENWLHDQEINPAVYENSPNRLAIPANELRDLLRSAFEAGAESA